MNFNQIEMRRETIFKDAVLSAAEAKSMEIISAAQQEAANRLAEAQAGCEETDHDAMMAALAPDTEREHSMALQQARQALLHHRTELVDGLFDDVEKQLAAFAKGPGYREWLLKRLNALAETAQKGDNAKVYVRKEDICLEKELKTAIDAAEVIEDEAIRLGGAKVQCGQLLYDLTLDDALWEEKERFEETSGMTL
ncbi:V-type proton ATPase subunit E [Ruminococcaceae bacterium OttesenSCG-928-A11]|nr:V-type proton ATPase subunit E [Ruminococcaceae bacterium OttesenSCG-928-A11]